MKLKLLNKFIVFIFLLVFVSCSGEKEKSINPINTIVSKPIEPKIKYIESELNDLLVSIRSESQKFTIKGNKDSFIVGEKGTILTIPKGTFINDKNEVVQGKIVIELIEALTVSDFILNGLQTVSENQILNSGGMLFVDAFSDKKPLKIDPTKQINVDLKSDVIDPKMKLFTGDLTSGSINWKEPKKLESDNLISIPLDLLDFGLCGWECGFNKEQIVEIKNKKYQDTYISTREFEQRMCNLAFLSCEQYDPLDDEILNIYKKNIKNNLSYSDGLVVKYLEKKYGKIIDTNFVKEHFEFDEKSWITSIYMQYVSFSKQALTKPLNIKGVDWNIKLSRKELEEKGYNESEIDKIISYQNLREKVIQEKKDEKESYNIASYNFNINELGWLNIDAYMNDPFFQESTFEVVVENQNEVNSLNVTLVLPYRKASVFPIVKNGNRYSFTKKKDGYRKLPIDEQALIIAIGVKNGIPFFGFKEIKIPRNGSVQIKMLQLEKELIAKKINEISKR